MKYLITTEPQSKPLRFILLVNDRIFARGLTRKQAEELVVALELVRLNPELAQHVRTSLQSKGVI